MLEDEVIKFRNIERPSCSFIVEKSYWCLLSRAPQESAKNETSN